MCTVCQNNVIDVTRQLSLAVALRRAVQTDRLVQFYAFGAT